MQDSRLQTTMHASSCLVILVLGALALGAGATDGTGAASGQKQDDSGPVKNICHDTPICAGAYKGDAGIVTKALEGLNAEAQKKLANVEDNWGYRPLHYASYYGHAAAARVLVAAGASVDAPTHTHDGHSRAYTALMLAAQKGEREVVDLLLKGGADERLRDADGEMARDIISHDMSGAVSRLLWQKDAAWLRKELKKLGLGGRDAKEL